MSEKLDLLTVGRISVDIYPQQIGVDIEDVETFGKYIGGSPTNVAIAAARYGRASAVVTRTGQDAFGRYLRRDLAQEFGVDTRFVGTDPNLLTPVTFCAIKPPEDFPLYFYRAPSAPDLQITAGDILAPDCARAVRTVPILWTTVTGLSAEPSRSAHEVTYRLRARADASASGLADAPAPHIADLPVSQAAPPSGSAAPGRDRWSILDLDYRPMFWACPQAARDAVRAALPYADVMVGNRTECAVAVGEGSPDEQADRLLEAGAHLAVVKMGSDGVLGATAAERIRCPTVPVTVVNGLGAGDAFGGALCHGLLAGWSLEEILNFANAAGATVASRVACSSAMPTAAEVADLLRARGRPVPRGL